jgi:hypothetical protein
MPRSRKSYPPSLKVRVVVETFKNQKTAAEIAQVYGIHPTAYHTARAPRVRQRGHEWRGPCPIHDGRDDNFAVNAADTGLWFCHHRSSMLLALRFDPLRNDLTDPLNLQLPADLPRQAIVNFRVPGHRSLLAFCWIHVDRVAAALAIQPATRTFQVTQQVAALYCYALGRVSVGRAAPAATERGISST